jgi:oligosaccharide repeat unit polymerase
MKFIITSLHGFILLVTFFVGLVLSEYRVDYSEFVYISSVVLLFLSAWCYLSWFALSKTLFDPYSIFLCAALAFNASQAYLEVFNLNKHGLLEGHFFTDFTLARCIYLVTISILCFHLGALLAFKETNGLSPCTPYYRDNPQTYIFESSALGRIGWYLFAISFIPSLMLMKEAITTVLSTGYMGLYAEEKAVGVAAAGDRLSMLLVPAIFFILLSSRYHKKNQILAISVITVYAVCNFFLGKRWVAITPLLTLAWLWNYRIKPIPKGPLLASALVLFGIVSPLIRATRVMKGEDRTNIAAFAEAYMELDNPLVTQLTEMGQSMMTVAYTIDLVPSIRSFQKGLDYVYAVFSLIPNLFWEIHPTKARGVPADWLVWTVDPSFAKKGGGLGYSFIAEAFLNFGWVGGPVFVGLLGFLWARSTLYLLSTRGLLQLAFVANMLLVVPFFARAETSVLLRPIVWYSLLPHCIGLYLINKFRIRYLRPFKNTGEHVLPASFTPHIKKSSILANE